MHGDIQEAVANQGAEGHASTVDRDTAERSAHTELDATGLDSTTWTSALERFEDGEFAAIPLTDAAALREESEAMRNCVRQHGKWYVNGCYRVFSVRATDSGKRVGTMEIYRIAQLQVWLLADMRRFANEIATGSLLEFGLAVARLYTAVTGGDVQLNDRYQDGMMQRNIQHMTRTTARRPNLE